MNNYHIYDAIGRGEESVVYKGRRKQSVHYVAIKSTGKGTKPSVLKEVKVLHSLTHPCILGFESWYETSNHLWLILEYCVGGALSSLLATDGKVAATTVLALAREIADALQFVHSSGMLHCALHPSSILLDEHGHARLAGFSSSQQIKSAAPIEDAAQMSHAAPEVKYDGAPASIASDLWSFGCLLYQCLTGKLPSSDYDVAKERLTDQRTDPSLADLVMRLIDRNPATRIKWPAVCSHSVWKSSPLPLYPLPNEPSFQQYASQSHASELTRAYSSISTSNNDEVMSQRGGPAADSMATPAHPLKSVRQSDAAAGASSIQTEVSNGASLSRMADDNNGYAALIWHPTDTVLKPIVGNRRIERPTVWTFDPVMLPFTPMSAQEILKCPPTSRSRFLENLCTALRGPNAAQTQLEILSYLATLCQVATVTQVLVNSDVAVLLVAMLRNTSALSSVVRTRIAHVLGLLIRHASEVDVALAHAGIVSALIAGCRDADVNLARQSTAALGELLFYVTSKPVGSDPAATQAWDISNDIVAVVLQLLQPDVDEVVKHYAAKSIENICSIGGTVASKFCTSATALTLLDVIDSKVLDSVRGTAASALCRLVKLSPSVLAGLRNAGKLSWIPAGLTDSSPRVEQATATILCQILASGSVPLQIQQRQQKILDGCDHLIESSVPVLQGKAVLAAALFISCNPAVVIPLTNTKLIAAFDKLVASKDSYLSAACSALVSALPVAISSLLEMANERLSNGKLSAAADIFGALGVLVNSIAIRTDIVNEEIISSYAYALSRCTEAAMEPVEEWDNLVMTLVDAMEVLCTHEDVLLPYYSVILSETMPALSLAVHYGQKNHDICFRSLRLLYMTILNLVSEPDLYSQPAVSSTSNEQQQGRGIATDAINTAVINHVMPLLPSMFHNEEPFPLYAIKLLSSLIPANVEWMVSVYDLGLMQFMFEWLQVDHPYCIVHLIRLCSFAVEAGVLGVDDLQNWQASSKAAEILEYAVNASVDAFVEPALELCLRLVETDPGSWVIIDKLPCIISMLQSDNGGDIQMKSSELVALLCEQHATQFASALSSSDIFSSTIEVMQRSNAAPETMADLTMVFISLHKAGLLSTLGKEKLAKVFDVSSAIMRKPHQPPEIALAARELVTILS